MIKWIKEKLGISSLLNKIEHLEDENRRLGLNLRQHELFVENRLKEFTRVDADVGFRGNNTIILTGIYRNKGYVQFYDLGEGEFESLVHQLRDMKKYALIRTVDAPAPFNATFDLF